MYEGESPGGILDARYNLGAAACLGPSKMFRSTKDSWCRPGEGGNFPPNRLAGGLAAFEFTHRIIAAEFPLERLGAIWALHPLVKGHGKTGGS